MQRKDICLSLINGVVFLWIINFTQNSMQNRIKKSENAKNVG